MKRSEWLKTPYAASDARDPDRAIRDLLTKYGVKDVQVTETTGPNGRPEYSLRFILQSKTYRVALEVLHADATPAELVKQVKRAVFHMLKSLLEFAAVFGPFERSLFAYLETPYGPTLYEAAAPTLAQLQAAPDFRRLMLPPAREGGAP